MATDAQRAAMHYVMEFLLNHRHRCHYAEVRPMRSETIRSMYGLKQRVAAPGGLIMDCSEAVTLICKVAGLEDPNGLAYSGNGYTGTLLDHLPHYSDPGAGKVGALCVFGPGTGTHVAMVYARGHDPLLWTHGEEGDPSLHRLSWMRPGFEPPVTFLSVAAL
jgi:hypothetical protein